MLGPLWIRRCISAQGHCRAASAVDLSGPREFPPSSRRGARGLRNICVGSSRLQKLQGTDIRGAPARLQNFRREAAHASKYVHWGLKGFKESQGGCSGGKARERRFFRRLRSVLQNVCGGAGRTFNTSAVGRRELQDICSAFSRGFQKSAGRFTGLDIFCCSSNCEKSRAERASRKSRGASDFSKGRRLHIFAAELPAPSKLQGCASFDISAARSPRTSKDPQGASQASRYFARETEVVESLELSGLRNVCWAARVVSGRGKNCPPSHSANEPGS